MIVIDHHEYICPGYIEPNNFETVPDGGRNEPVDASVAYEAVLCRNGHFAGGQTLRSPGNAKTLRRRNRRVVVTDGPYAETKEQLGGILILKSKDLEHAVRLMDKHPGLVTGPFQIQPAEDLNGMVREIE